MQETGRFSPQCGNPGEDGDQPVRHGVLGWLPHCRPPVNAVVAVVGVDLGFIGCAQLHCANSNAQRRSVDYLRRSAGLRLA